MRRQRTSGPAEKKAALLIWICAAVFLTDVLCLSYSLGWSSRGGRARKETSELSVLSGMQYPHWMMVVGAVLIVCGFVGFAVNRNRNGAAADQRTTEAALLRRADYLRLEAATPQ